MICQRLAEYPSNREKRTEKSVLPFHGPILIDSDRDETNNLPPWLASGSCGRVERNCDDDRTLAGSVGNQHQFDGRHSNRCRATLKSWRFNIIRLHTPNTAKRELL